MKYCVMWRIYYGFWSEPQSLRASQPATSRNQYGGMYDVPRPSMPRPSTAREGVPIVSGGFWKEFGLANELRDTSVSIWQIRRVTGQTHHNVHSTPKSVKISHPLLSRGVEILHCAVVTCVSRNKAGCNLLMQRFHYPTKAHGHWWILDFPPSWT